MGMNPTITKELQPTQNKFHKLKFTTLHKKQGCPRQNIELKTQTQ